MNKYTLLLTLFLLQYTCTQAQENIDYNWSKAQYDTISETYQKENEVVILERKIMEYYNDKTTNSFNQLDIFHKKVQVNSDDAISTYNTLYLPASGGNKELVAYKARVITKEGKVRELSNEAVKTAKDEESESEYKYLAFEGVELGSQLEFFFVVRNTANYTGSMYTYQSNVVKQRVEFKLIAPAHLWFAFKTFNEAPEVEKDTNELDFTVYTFLDENVSKLKPEPWGNYRVNLKRILYKIDANIATGKRNLVKFGDASQNVFANTYNNVSKADKKTLAKIIKNAKISASDSEEDKIFKLEHYVKKNIAIVDASMPELYDITKSVGLKYTNSIGMVRIMANAFKELDIPHEIVITCDREEIRFEEDFESYVYLDHYLFYFPNIKKYLDPNSMFYRLGIIPSEYTFNKGLFIKEVTVAGYTTGAGRVKYIEAPGKDNCYDKMIVTTTFSEDLTQNKITLYKEAFGFYATSFQPIFELVDPDQKKELQEALVKFLSENITIDKVEIENDNSESVGRKPLITRAEITSAAFIEKAGAKVLFKVGDLIGPQAELYTEEERKLPVENDYNRSYHRTIIVHIPDGYTVDNLDDINIEKSIKEDDGSVSALFKSSYQKEGNKITVIAEEWYDKIDYPVEKFEDYRAVINAAADFNKVVWVIHR